MQVNATLDSPRTKHDISQITHVIDERAPNGAFVLTTSDGSRVRWESLSENALESIDEELFDTQLRSLYRDKVDVEYPREKPKPQVISPEIESYTRQTVYLSAESKDNLMNFYEASETEGANRCHEQEAMLRVVLKHKDELVDAAADTCAECEERYALRVEESTWRKFETDLLELEIQNPVLEKCSKTDVYEAVATVAQNHPDEFEQIASSLSK